MFDHVDAERIENARTVIGDAGADRALGLLASSPDAPVWRWLFQVLGLVAGSCLIVAGVVMLVAFNWWGLGPYSKLLVAVVPFVVAAFVGATRGDAVGEVALGAAGFLIGPMFVVYSQQYQTGADPWTLFAAWTALALPWAVLSRTAGVWLGIWALVITTVGTVGHQVLDWGEGVLHAVLWVSIAWTIAWELRSPQRIYPRLLAAVAFVGLALSSTAAVFDAVSPVAPITLVLLVAVAQPVYLRARPDLAMIGLSATALTWLVGSLGVRAVYELDLEALIMAFLMMGYWTVLGVFLVVYLRLAMGWIRARVD